MQTPKTRNGSEVVRRVSPITSKTNHSAKVAASDSDPTSPNQIIRSPNDKILKLEKGSLRSLVPEKPRRPSKASELECQIIQLQQELKKARDELSSTEAWKRRAQQEAEETKKELLVTSVKLEDSRNQLVELSAAEEARLHELRNISHQRDRAWQSEHEAIQQQHSVDSAALASAMNEIQRLKMQLDMALRSKAARAKEEDAIERSELQVAKQNLTEALLAIESFKVQLRDCGRAESEARAMFTETRNQLGVAQHTIEALLLDGSRLMESFNIIATELKESRSRVNSLEEIVAKGAQEDQCTACSQASSDSHLKKKMQGESADSEVGQLVSSVEAITMMYHQEQMGSVVKLNHAYELMDKMSDDSRMREDELESRLNDAKSEAIVLKASLFDRESKLRSLRDANEKLLRQESEGEGRRQVESEIELKLAQSAAHLSELKAKLVDRETTLQAVVEENQGLRSELKKSRDAHREATAEVELAKAAEKDALLKLSCAAKEAEANDNKASMSAEQLDAAEAIRSEMEAELKRLKVQAEQWRKAAEAGAAAVLTAGSDGGRFIMERTGSLDSEYDCTRTKLEADDLDDESSWKKRNSMLRKLGGMWKKDQKAIR